MPKARSGQRFWGKLFRPPFSQTYQQAGISGNILDPFGPRTLPGERVGVWALRHDELHVIGTTKAKARPALLTDGVAELVFKTYLLANSRIGSGLGLA